MDNGQILTSFARQDCSEPPHVIDSTNRRSGIYSFYRCHQGFYPVGESRIVCQDGTWSAVIFKCSKYCGTPPNIPYSKQQISGYMAGAVTSYDCLNGYVAIGYTKRICNATGEWSSGNLTCLKDCSKPPNVADSTYDRSGISSFYRCHQGFYLVGEPSIICKDGAWSAVKFKCSKYCGQPPNIQFSTNQINGNMSGAVASYHCISGYVPVGEPSIVCNARGQWSTGHLSCLKDCSTPPTISLSTAVYSSTYSGSKVVYYCKSGYTGIGNPVATCWSDGKWTTSNFYCKYIAPSNISSLDKQGKRSLLFLLVISTVVLLLI